MPQMTRWFKQIVSAVGYIHDKKLIHRDLKVNMLNEINFVWNFIFQPRNILLYDEDVLKVCDLGIVAERAMMSTESAQEIESERTSEQGTPMYMAPEQVYRYSCYLWSMKHDHVHVEKVKFNLKKNCLCEFHLLQFCRGGAITLLKSTYSLSGWFSQRCMYPWPRKKRKRSIYSLSNI